MKVLRPFFCFLIASVGLFACRKEIDALPDATTTGANTFGAKLDGSFWIPRRQSSLGSAEILSARITGTGALFINAKDLAGSPKETEFEIYLHQLHGTGTYALNANTANFPDQSASYGYYVERTLTPQNEWITNASFTGVVTLTRLDTVAKIVSGTFSFRAASIDSSASPVDVEEGRFDVKLAN